MGKSPSENLISPTLNDKYWTYWNDGAATSKTRSNSKLFAGFSDGEHGGFFNQSRKYVIVNQLLKNIVLILFYRRENILPQTTKWSGSSTTNPSHHQSCVSVYYGIHDYSGRHDEPRARFFSPQRKEHHTRVFLLFKFKSVSPHSAIMFTKSNASHMCKEAIFHSLDWCARKLRRIWICINASTCFYHLITLSY